MPITVRKLDSSLTRATALAHNTMLRAITADLTTYPHADASARTSGDFTSPIVTVLACVLANATTLNTTIALANELKIVCNEHFGDAVAHDAADTANVITTAIASDQTTANTLLNAIKTNVNLHLAQAGVHFTNDAINTVSAADATDAGSSQTLATALKAAVNAHIILALGGGGAGLNQVTA